MNFAKTDKDSIKAKPSVTLPPGFTFAGVTVGVYVAGHSDQLVLDAKGKAKSSSGTVAIALKTAKTGTTTVTYTVKKSALQAEVAPLGLTDRTTAKPGEAVVLPVAVTIGSSTGGSVYFGAVTQTYKAKAGKSGKASNAK